MTDNNMIDKKRFSGPDIIRCLCCMFVVFEHFFLNCGYYDEPLVGGVMLTETFFRWFFLICIPMYMMLTGYFKLNKKPEKSHYMSILPIAISYIVISIPKMILYNRLYGEIYGPKEALKNLGNYNIAWYMGLYIGLMILAPMLNKLWHALEDKREQHILIVSLIILCSIYPVFHYIAPSFFVSLYPIMYYFIGAYIRTYQPKGNKWVLFGVFLLTVAIQTAISFYGVRGGTFDWNLISTPDTGFGSIFILVGAVCVFLIFYDVDVKNAFMCKVLKMVGEVSFEVYLFAGAYDAVIYSYFKRTVVGAVAFSRYFVVTAVISFIAAVISSIIYKIVYKSIAGMIRPKNRSI